MINSFNNDAQNYLLIFSSYVNQFLHWGQWLFYSLLIIQIVWMCLWYAFDFHSFTDSMAAFIKRFFVITLFYTIMINPSWLAQIIKTILLMGSTLTHMALDPASLIETGIGIANKIIHPLGETNLLNAGFSMIVISAVYLVILFVFINIAVDLSIALIIPTALISVATFLLGFSALNATSAIARKILDVILANCIKLLGLYLVVAAGSKTLVTLSNAIPTAMKSFDPYVWIVASTLLFLALSKVLPQQLVTIISGMDKQYSLVQHKRDT